jgi:predicted AAA+ superfamily ATPase
MNRDAYRALREWKSSARRKPLLLRGARQTGKTYLLKEFGRLSYDNMHYFNFEEDPALGSLFERDLKPKRIVADLSIACGSKIRTGSDLVVLDEIQASNAALNSLKYFNEQANEYHIAAAGSLLGVELSKPKSFPVGKVDLMTLPPMTFYEFLDAIGCSAYRARLESLDRAEPLPEKIHQELLVFLRTYYYVGGMPEAVTCHVERHDPGEVRDTQRGILEAYVLDFAKHTPVSEIPKLSLIWDSLPSQLARENKRFLFSTLKAGARAREYENALQWLDRAGLVVRAFCLEAPKRPLKAYADPATFKTYVFDVGLLGAMSNLSADILARGDALFAEYHGALAENYVAQSLVAGEEEKLYYWRNRRGSAEVDFILDSGGAVVPLEVKAGINPRSKSLKTFADKFGCKRLCRTTALNLRRDGPILNIPLYALPRLRTLIGT